MKFIKEQCKRLVLLTSLIMLLLLDHVKALFGVCNVTKKLVVAGVLFVLVGKVNAGHLTCSSS